jgi:hypothetical protein
MQLEKPGTETVTSINFLFVLALQFHSRDAILIFRIPKFHIDSQHGLLSEGLQ